MSLLIIKIRILLLGCLSLVVLAGCSSVTGGSTKEKQEKAKAVVTWPYAKDAIKIELSSDVDLNFYANRSHTLVLGVLQFDDEKTFPKLLTKPTELAKFLATGNLPKGVLQFDRYVVKPDARILMQVDRVQNAQFVGVIAGYYQFDPARSARYFRIPLNMDSSGLVFKDYKAEPAILALRLALGAQRIANAQSLTHDPDAPVVKQEVSVNNDDLEIKLSPDVLKQTAEQASALIKL